jgi:hypothetical protein
VLKFVNFRFAYSPPSRRLSGAHLGDRDGATLSSGSGTAALGARARGRWRSTSGTGTTSLGLEDGVADAQLRDNAVDQPGGATMSARPGVRFLLEPASLLYCKQSQADF